MMEVMKTGYKFWSKGRGLKMIVRIVHVGLCLLILAGLLWKNTGNHTVQNIK